MPFPMTSCNLSIIKALTHNNQTYRQPQRESAPMLENRSCDKSKKESSKIIEDILTHAEEVMTPAMHNEYFISALVTVALVNLCWFSPRSLLSIPNLRSIREWEFWGCLCFGTKPMLGRRKGITTFSLQHIRCWKIGNLPFLTTILSNQTMLLKSRCWPKKHQLTIQLK